MAKRMESADKQNAVETAILLDKLRHCYELLLFPESKLEKETVETLHEEKRMPVTRLIPTETVEEEPANTPLPQKPVEVVTPEPIAAVKPASKPAEPPRVQHEEEPKTTTIDKTAKIVKKHETLGEKHLAGKRFLKDYLAENISKNDLSTKQQKMPIADLNKAFRVIDIFRFTKELFKNDNLLFQNTIQTLNEMHSLEDALIHIGANFDWKADEPTVIQFIEILQRRFM